ncbi:MAG: hypothetical protein JXB07_05535 [Anaerolineae bacterium]|nr:hypothetical protein [Anaerolineae bacterium]
MSFLDRIFGPKNLTSDWIANPGVPLRIDLDSGRFCKVDLGSPIDSLAHLGPGKHIKGRGHEQALVYEHHGVQLFIDEALCLDTVDITLLAEGSMVAFSGDWYFHGEPVAIDADSTPADIQTILGPPDKIFPSGDISYACSRGDIEFSWDGGDLDYVLIVRRT